ncbi:hypothetical protein L596_005329 [Steinernema carpocapsae]|nr:hypothetical protein L596_005329 [Steinernema carpocapsae]
MVDSLPKIDAHLSLATDEHFFPPPEQSVSDEINGFIRFAAVHKDYELGRQYFYALQTMISYKSEIRRKLKDYCHDLKSSTEPLERLYKQGEKITYRTFHAHVRQTMKDYCCMSFRICEKAYKNKKSKTVMKKSYMQEVSVEEILAAVKMHERGIDRANKIIEEFQMRPKQLS